LVRESTTQRSEKKDAKTAKGGASNEEVSSKKNASEGVRRPLTRTTTRREKVREEHTRKGKELISGKKVDLLSKISCEGTKDLLKMLKRIAGEDKISEIPPSGGKGENDAKDSFARGRKGKGS